MSKYKKQLPAPLVDDLTYFVSRDSLAGKLSATCTLWYKKPLRVKRKHRIVWVDKDKEGYLGEFRPAEVVAWFGTLPETDLELIRVDTRVKREGDK